MVCDGSVARGVLESVSWFWEYIHTYDRFVPGWRGVYRTGCPLVSFTIVTYDVNVNQCSYIYIVLYRPLFLLYDMSCLHYLVVYVGLMS